MLYFKINYIFHILLHSKYKTLLSLILYLLLYYLIINNSFTYCMTNDFEGITNNNDNPQLSDLKREIKSYAGSQVYLLERIDEQTRLIEEQKQTINELSIEIEGTEHKKITAYLGSFSNPIYKVYSVGGYKNDLKDLQSKLLSLEQETARLKTDLIRKEAIIGEYRRTRNL